MKKSIKIVALILALVVITASFAGCSNPKKDIVGKWMDSSSMSGYMFNDDGTVKVIYVNLTIPVINTPLSGSVVGAYTIEDETLTITYSIYNRSFTKAYTYEFVDNTLSLTDIESGERSVYIRQEVSEDDDATTVRGIEF